MAMDIHWCDVAIWSPLLGANVVATVYLDQPLTAGVSARQSALLKQFTEMKSGLDDIKNALFEHWGNHDLYWNILTLRNGDEAYDNSELVGLIVQDAEHEWGWSASLKLIHML